MLTTEFLLKNQFGEYGSWLKAQDPQTLQHYFGYALTHDSIDALIEQFSANTKNHHFLIAKIDSVWAGSIHIASNNKNVELGVIIGLAHRKKGLASVMMDEALTWARNRYYQSIYMHCIGWNLPIQHLSKKHGLVSKNIMGDSEANLQLKPPTPFSFLKEQMTIQRNLSGIFHIRNFGNL